jgi:hypothetical protein
MANEIRKRAMMMKGIVNEEHLLPFRQNEELEADVVALRNFSFISINVLRRRNNV